MADTPSQRVDVDALPDELAERVAGADLEPISIGRSASVVARVRRDGHHDLVLKLAERGAEIGGIAAEAARTRWLSTRFPAPRIVADGGDDRVEWLLAEALPGRDATASPLAGDPARLAHQLGRILRRLHDDVDPADCPFDGRTATLLAHARAQVAAGRVDPADFQPIHRGLGPDELLAVVEQVAPDDPADPVVTHGDYCLPNVVLTDEGELAGLVDLGLLGVGDRYRDIGIGARSIAANLGGPAVGPFVDGYGIDRPDLARIDAFVMLDELF